MSGRRGVVVVAVAALAALLVAFGPPPERAGDANTLRITSQTPPDSIDPQVSWLSTSWQLQVNVYNGLLTFRKETGVAGTELVPDLATAMPRITDGGRTLTFRVRRGVQFGAPADRELRPSDVKYTFDRLALIESQAVGMFSVIEGFDRVYRSGRGSVEGVVADDRAGTVTFHLQRADATFLYSLALPFAYVVPRGTPAKDLSQGARPPATGPYTFTEYTPSRRVVLERNPAFRQWSEHTPKGEVDRIVMTFGVSDENATTQIMQGQSDLAVTMIPRSRLPFLLTSDEWRPYLHEHELSRTSYIWMNTQLAPFDDVRVRQAVNWAIDRRAISKLNGGAGVPSSTILPPTMAGYTGYEPYPEQDLARAKQLIADSGVDPGAAGEVVIWCYTTPPFPDFAQYLRDALTQLGFSARARCIDQSSYYNVIGNQRTGAQIGFASWGADYPEGATFIDANLNGAKINPDHSANYAWYSGADREIARINAMVDLDQRAAAWGRLDRRIIERDAAWAPMYHSVQRNLVSKRTGNYVFHPLFDVLLSQAPVDGSGINNADLHEGEAGRDGE